MTFNPTHIIKLADKTSGHELDDIPVQLCDDGVAYTKQEWESSVHADWERTDDGDWLFQGRATPNPETVVTVKKCRYQVRVIDCEDLGGIGDLGRVVDADSDPPDPELVSLLAAEHHWGVAVVDNKLDRIDWGHCVTDYDGNEWTGAA